MKFKSIESILLADGDLLNPEPEVEIQPVIVEEYVNRIFLNDSTANLASYNTETGEFVYIGNTSQVLTDIAVSADGRLFGTSFNTLYEVDLATAELTTIARYDGVTSMNALAFLPDGTLVAAGFNTSDLFEVNIETAGLTSLGNIGAASAGDLAVHEGELLMSTTSGQLIAINVGLDASATTTTTLGSVSSTTYGLASQGENDLFSSINTSLFALNEDSASTELVANFAEHGISRIYGLSAYNEVIVSSTEV